MSLYSMMQNNAFFPAFSHQLGNYAGNHKKETQVPSSSNASTKLQNFGLFMNPQHCDSFHLTGFSSSNGNKDGGDVKAKLVTSSRTSTYTRSLNHQHHNNAMVDKQQPGSKRQKTLHVEYQSRTMFSKSLQKQQITSKRSQKLGDRITALQQLVSPYGKTDTASVLYEATVCIKLLHEHIKVLTSPYFQIKSLACLQDDKEKREEEDLVTRGLCLVPFSAINNPDRNSQKTIHRFP